MIVERRFNSRNRKTFALKKTIFTVHGIWQVFFSIISIFLCLPFPKNLIRTIFNYSFELLLSNEYPSPFVFLHNFYQSFCCYVDLKILISPSPYFSILAMCSITTFSFLSLIKPFRLNLKAIQKQKIVSIKYEISKL